MKTVGDGILKYSAHCVTLGYTKNISPSFFFSVIEVCCYLRQLRLLKMSKFLLKSVDVEFAYDY